MATHIEDWNLLRSFIAVYEEGTLTAAAHRLGMTQPNVGRHLRALEDSVGEVLFTRLPGKLAPTARAHAFFDTLIPLRDAVGSAQSLFDDKDTQVSGVVRVSVAQVYSSHLVPQLLASLLAAQPALEIELTVSNRVDNLLKREADIAIRFMRPEQDALIARKVGDVEWGLFAHEQFIAKYGEPKEMALAPGAFIAGFDREAIDPAASIKGSAPMQLPRFRFRSDAPAARQAVVEAGEAVGMYLLDDAARNPKLRRVLEHHIGLTAQVWLCAHEELNRSPRMRTVWDALVRGLEAHFRENNATV